MKFFVTSVSDVQYNLLTQNYPSLLPVVCKTGVDIFDSGKIYECAELKAKSLDEAIKILDAVLPENSKYCYVINTQNPAFIDIEIYDTYRE